MASTDSGRAVLEELVRAAFPELADTSRQPDPAETAPPPECGGGADPRGRPDAAGGASGHPVPDTERDTGIQ
jgi:hypothetical protein